MWWVNYIIYPITHHTHWRIMNWQNLVWKKPIHQMNLHEHYPDKHNVCSCKFWIHRRIGNSGGRWRMSTKTSQWSHSQGCLRWLVFCSFKGQRSLDFLDRKPVFWNAQNMIKKSRSDYYLQLVRPIIKQNLWFPNYAKIIHCDKCCFKRRMSN